MPAVKKYTRINFQNYPSTSTPLNATNLNKMDKGIDDLDDEVVTVKNAIENMSFDANSISYDNTSSGLQATDVQDAVDEINDNLSGFKFYPTGTGIVGLISDDSAYTDANGKYVIWGTATANQLVADNPNTYKSVPSTEDLRGEVGADTGVPFSKSEILVNLADCIIHHSSANRSLTTGVYNATNDITVTNNITNATTAAGYVDAIDLTISFSRARKINLLLNGYIENWSDRNQTTALTVKHNTDTVYSNSVTNTGKKSVQNLFSISVNVGDTVTIKLNTNGYYNNSMIGVTLC